MVGCAIPKTADWDVLKRDIDRLITDRPVDGWWTGDIEKPDSERDSAGPADHCSLGFGLRPSWQGPETAQRSCGACC
jgi:hypothetical protein